jgi:hypothetical protein
MDTGYRVPLLTDAQPADMVVQSLLEHTKAASGGRLLNMHRQMATAPTVLAGYMGLRDALAAHATAGGRTRSAIAVAASAADRGEYTLAVNRLLAEREGWSDEQITAIAEGQSSGDADLDALLDVVRDAATGDGSVADQAWNAAHEAGWSPELLAETFAYVGLVTYCDRFVRYAGTEFDVRPAAPAAGEPAAG